MMRGEQPIESGTVLAFQANLRGTKFHRDSDKPGLLIRPDQRRLLSCPALMAAVRHELLASRRFRDVFSALAFLTLAAFAFLAAPVSSVRASGLPEIAEPIPACHSGYGPPEEQGWNEEGAFQSGLAPNCLYQPAANGVAHISPSKVKIGGTVRLTFTPGTQDGYETSPIWNLGALRTVQGPEHEEQFLVALYNQEGECYELAKLACEFSVSTLGRFIEGYYVLRVPWQASNTLEREGSYDLQLYVGEHNPPVARFTVEPVKGLTYKFDGTSSSDEVRVSAWHFTVNGILVSEIPLEEYTFPGPGTYKIGLTVEDEAGLSDSTEHEVVISEPVPSTGGGGGSSGSGGSGGPSNATTGKPKHPKHRHKKHKHKKHSHKH